MIAVVKATVEDIPTIREMAHLTWPPTFRDILSQEQIEYMLEMMYSEKALKEQIEVKKHQFFLAKESEKALGYLSVEVDYNQKPTIKIHKIYILPDLQGKGIGKLLMQKAEQVALENKNTILSLNVNRFNQALKFYESLGFSITKTEDINIGNGYLMEDFVMEKNL
ncbi:MAG: GNAT family N-acetyltransferase [Flavobacteriaceae bacterium]